MALQFRFGIFGGLRPLGPPLRQEYLKQWEVKFGPCFGKGVTLATGNSFV